MLSPRHGIETVADVFEDAQGVGEDGRPFCTATTVCIAGAMLRTHSGMCVPPVDSDHFAG